jgi:hypothetical protein
MESRRSKARYDLKGGRCARRARWTRRRASSEEIRTDGEAATCVGGLACVVRSAHACPEKTQWTATPSGSFNPVIVVVVCVPFAL